MKRRENTLRPWERRRIRELSDRELIREVRGLVQVERAVSRFRGRP